MSTDDRPPALRGTAIPMGTLVRFNDLMQTVLAADAGTGLGAVTLWRQCVDLLAQHDRHDRAPMHPRERGALLERLTELRPRVSETQRIATVVELGGRMKSTALVQFFASDRPAIAAAAMARAQLPDRLWVNLVPRIGPTARGVLRGRRDLGLETRQALEAFGSTDFVLTNDAAGVEAEPDMLLTPEMVAPWAVPHEPLVVEEDAPVPADEDGRVLAFEPRPRDPDQIRNLVDRIERFTSQRRPQSSDPVAEPDAAPRDFAFETDVRGVVIWIEQGPRAALIGLCIGEIALEGGSGPDAYVVGAFTRRSGFRNGRFAIVGGVMAGEWRVTATPIFDSRSGRFQGFRGQARRPHLHEVAAAPEAVEAGIAGLSADSLRQLVHELRTPLNAILGFAEIIEQQLFGPAPDDYRGMAGKIVVDARHLLTAFDDLDLAARVSHGAVQGAPRSVDPAMLIAHVTARFREQAHADAPQIDIDVTRDLPAVRIDPAQGERMVQHLIRTLISVALPGETLAGSLWMQSEGKDGRVVLALNRPASLEHMEEAQLLDPGYTPEGDWPDGPLLGLGFSLRLIRSMAAGNGASLAIEPDRFLLSLPVAHAMEEAASDR